MLFRAYYWRLIGSAQAWDFSRRGKRKKEKGKRREREFTIGVNGVALPILLVRKSPRFIPAPTIIGTAMVCRRLIKRDWYTREVCVASKRNCRRRRHGMKITKGREMCGGDLSLTVFFSVPHDYDSAIVRKSWRGTSKEERERRAADYWL